MHYSLFHLKHLCVTWWRHHGHYVTVAPVGSAGPARALPFAWQLAKHFLSPKPAKGPDLAPAWHQAGTLCGKGTWCSGVAGGTDREDSAPVQRDPGKLRSAAGTEASPRQQWHTMMCRTPTPVTTHAGRLHSPGFTVWGHSGCTSRSRVGRLGKGPAPRTPPGGRPTPPWCEAQGSPLPGKPQLFKRGLFFRWERESRS